ncbi:MAG TPA: serine/threonine-protein kinase [Polyangia bacterium]|nr:serine/threonine-protein kinase [Polyangia bacterium]
MPKSSSGDPDPSARTVELGTVFDAQPVGLKPGSVLASRYQIEAAIGEGGSGQVFRAWDRVLGEPIALKILRPDRAHQKTWIKRLAREVRVARAIRHANVCRVFDLGNADGQWFVSMELATGGTLRDTLRSGKARPLSERLVDARAICAGLAAIHQVGITHRDVTPRNVLRMADGRLLLSDFGLAIEGGDTTIEGGTPRYMPPETAMGQRSDQRSDVWQFGWMLYELLFERRPEWENGGQGLALQTPIAPGESSLDGRLSRLCRDCLAQNPAERPANAMEVAAQLAQAEIAQPRAGWVRFFGRPRGWKAAAVAVALMAGVFLGAALSRHWLAHRPSVSGIARADQIDDADRRLLRALAGTLEAQGRDQDARRLNRLAAVPARD